MGPQLVARCKTQVNNTLKLICKGEGLKQSGNKAELQSRVIGSMEHRSPSPSLAYLSFIEIATAVDARDLATLDRLRYRLFHQGASPPDPGSPEYSSPVQNTMPATSNGYGSSQRYAAYQPPPMLGVGSE